MLAYRAAAAMKLQLCTALCQSHTQALSKLFCCLQILYTMVAMVVSLTVFAYLLGEISNLVMDQDAELVKIRSQVRVAVQQQATRRWAA